MHIKIIRKVFSTPLTWPDGKQVQVSFKRGTQLDATYETNLGDGDWLLRLVNNAVVRLNCTEFQQCQVKV